MHPNLVANYFLADVQTHPPPQPERGIMEESPYHISHTTPPDAPLAVESLKKAATAKSSKATKAS
ncbi:hypothetical protein BDB00DRAFT_871809 [Zychaea mexicana]|uniref:uncharacterized protein n=1 Tax=Zychaea mexicana TaxID=64656 RepID=UPI0022FE7012|nr:uncharacterized protein BDB00DRAFT_871809 [Zychaea mexicana]KAI9494053.1 hypothetical protein BDB00DRAFT_871809 [Zychaea mexicana]